MPETKRVRRSAQSSPSAVVVNKRNNPFDVYIGRGSVWGNPFTVEEYGRDLCIDKYERYIRQRLVAEPDLVTELMALKGKVLGCFCKPKKCHGDILLQLIEEYSGNTAPVKRVRRSRQ